MPLENYLSTTSICLNTLEYFAEHIYNYQNENVIPLDKNDARRISEHILGIALAIITILERVKNIRKEFYEEYVIGEKYHRYDEEES